MIGRRVLDPIVGFIVGAALVGALSHSSFIEAPPPVGTSTAAKAPPQLEKPPVDWVARAVEYVNSEVDYASWAIAERAPPLTPEKREILMAATAVRYVANRLSPLRYGHFVQKARTKLPGNADQCFELEAGICGNQVDAAIRVLRGLGLRARSVQVYFHSGKERESHIVVEAFAGGSWRILDVTWGMWFLEDPSNEFSLASFQRVREQGLSRFKARIDATSPPYLTAVVAGNDVTTYLRKPSNEVVIVGMSGTVPLVASAKSPNRWIAEGLPSFVGKTFDHGELSSGTLSIRVRSLGTASGIEFEGGVAACVAGDVVLRSVGGAELARVPVGELPKSRWVIDLKSSKSEHIEIGIQAPPGQACYVVFSAIRVLYS